MQLTLERVYMSNLNKNVKFISVAVCLRAYACMCLLLAPVFMCIVCVCVSQDSGRLLYIGQNEWTHVNCALWSAEVFEDDDGSLKNVHMAVIRGKQLVRREGGVTDSQNALGLRRAWCSLCASPSPALRALPEAWSHGGLLSVHLHQ